MVAADESVLDVPPKLSARVRVLSSGNARKNEGLDALATALAVWRDERLPTVGPEAESEVLRLVSERREELVAERTRALKAASTDSCGTSFLVGYRGHSRPSELHASCTAYSGKALRPAFTDSWLRRSYCAMSGHWKRKIADLDGRIEAEVEASGTTLTEIFGLGPILAAKVIGTVGSVARIPTKAHFASYCGTAPVETSSGEVVRNGLSLAGNRHLNNALHMVAVCQAGSDVRARAYYRKNMAQGKSRKEALRRLKRRISDAAFKSLVADLEEPSSSVA